MSGGSLFGTFHCTVDSLAASSPCLLRLRERRRLFFPPFPFFPQTNRAFPKRACAAVSNSARARREIVEGPISAGFFKKTRALYLSVATSAPISAGNRSLFCSASLSARSIVPLLCGKQRALICSLFVHTFLSDPRAKAQQEGKRTRMRRPWTTVKLEPHARHSLCKFVTRNQLHCSSSSSADTAHPDLGAVPVAEAVHVH